MKRLLLIAALTAGLGVSLPAGTWAAAENHPPRFPKVKHTTSTTSFRYDSSARLIGAVTRIRFLTKPIDPDHDRLTYTWKVTNGTIRGAGPAAVWTRVISFGKVAPGTVTLVVRDGHGGRATAKLVFN